MADRVLVQQSVPTVELPDGTMGVGMSGEFVVDTRQYNVQVTPTVTAGAYSPGDAFGGKLTWTDVVDDEDGGGITIDSLVVTDKGKQAPDLDLVLFNQDFSPTADNAPFAPSNEDLLNIVAVIPTGDWALFANNAASTRHGIGANFVLIGSNLYGQLVTRTAPTPTAVFNISVRLGIRQD
jgi:hypothetical protein